MRQKTRPRGLRNSREAMASIMLGRTDLMGPIPVPAVFLNGDADTGWPDMAAHATQAGATSAVIPGAKHVPPLEQPEAVARHLAELWASF